MHFVNLGESKKEIIQFGWNIELTGINRWYILHRCYEEEKSHMQETTFKKPSWCADSSTNTKESQKFKYLIKTISVLICINFFIYNILLVLLLPLHCNCWCCWYCCRSEGWQRQMDTQTDIATYIPNRPRDWSSEKIMSNNSKLYF